MKLLLLRDEKEEEAALELVDSDDANNTINMKRSQFFYVLALHFPLSLSPFSQSEVNKRRIYLSTNACVLFFVFVFFFPTRWCDDRALVFRDTRQRKTFSPIRTQRQ